MEGGIFLFFELPRYVAPNCDNSFRDPVPETSRVLVPVEMRLLRIRVVCFFVLDFGEGGV